MLDAGGAAHVSKAMPVNFDPAATAEVAAVNETGCAAARDVSLVSVAADAEVVGAGPDGPDDFTAEARTLSTEELFAPHVASSSTA
ncbi:MAG TPA: hypothetical protein VFE92_05360 [Dermatophilaceae bacterium]|nr:hypothetical protein [Dermatophilaceae bacterium]